MHHFYFEKDKLWCEGCAVETVAGEFGTPLYLYSQKTIRDNYQATEKAFSGIDHLICYAVKANSNRTILADLASYGCGADVVSAGELYLALQSGIAAEKIVFAGVGKRDDEIRYALEKQILTFNVESAQELEVIDDLAKSKQQVAPVAIRLNPNIDIKGHPYISTGKAVDKFGIDSESANQIFRQAQNYTNVRLVGLHTHIGSQITSVEPYVSLASFLESHLAKLRTQGIRLEYVDIGGGLGVSYKDVFPTAPGRDFSKDHRVSVQEIVDAIRSNLSGFGCKVLFEPGRSLVAEAGILVTKVLYRKQSGNKTFVIVDAAMNDLIRPSLYNAYHEMVPLKRLERPDEEVDVVGPICESGDFLARNRSLPRLERGDLLAIMTTGAYGYTLSSNYNARPRPAEVLVDGKSFRVIRARETIEGLWA